MASELLLQVVELFPGPALVVGPGGEVLAANDRAGRWIGPGENPIAGRPLDRLVADPPERVAGFLDECRRAGRKVAGALTPRRYAGVEGRCRVEGIAVSPRPGEGDPTLVVIHAIPGEPDAGGRAGALEALREEVRRQDEFLDRLAHDLRNPAAAIIGALHLVRRATAPEDVAWAQDAMDRQVKHLVRQLDVVLELTRIGRGKVELHRMRVDGAAAARAASTSARPSLEERELRLTLATSPGDLAVDADPARLEQILVGLLGHVAGSAEPGSGLRLSVAREGDEVVFRVGDPSAPAPVPPGEAGPPRQESSLGLMLVRKLAELHGGSAAFRADAPGRRGEFLVRLPAADPAAAARPAAGTRVASASGERILVVDDNVDAASGTARLLQMAGHDVRVAHDGREALEVAHDHRPRFILLDIALPVMDGYEVARQLRGDPRHRDATIIALSGYSEDDYCPPQEAGFDHHLVKPLEYDALRAILARSTRGAD